MSGYYIRQLTLDDLVERAIPYMERSEAEGGLPDSIVRPLDRAYTKRVLHLEHERLKTLGEAASVISFFFEQQIAYETALLIQKGMDAPRTRAALLSARELLVGLAEWEHTIMEP